MSEKCKPSTRKRPPATGKQNTLSMKLDLDTIEFRNKLNELECLLTQRKKGYRIFTKEDYKRYMLSKEKDSSFSKGTIKALNKMWEKISNGYNFIIAFGVEESLIFYGVESFNNHVL